MAWGDEPVLRGLTGLQIAQLHHHVEPRCNYMHAWWAGEGRSAVRRCVAGT